MIKQQADSSRIEYKWLAMIVVSIGTFMSTLDASIVNVSLPTIRDALYTDLPMVEWVVTIYLLVITGLLLTLGRLADLIGRKPVFIAGFMVFTVGSVLCGLSWSIYALITFRALQAVGAAMIMANGPAIITHVFPGTERGKAMGIMGMTVAAGLTAGPPLGTFLIAKAGWPLIFFINLPIGIAGIAAAQKILRPEHHGYERHFDIPGAALLLVSLISFTMALNQGSREGWTRPHIWGLIAAFALMGVLFIIRERSTVHPVVDLALFRNRLFAAASISALIAYVGTFAVIFLMPFYMLDVLGYGKLQMGLTMTSIPLTTMVVAPLSGMLSDRIGSRLLGSLGLAVAAVGLVVISSLGLNPSRLHVVVSLVILGLGLAVFQSPNNSAIMGSVPTTMLGVASGMLATMRNLGMVAGVTITGAVYESRRLFYSSKVVATKASVLGFRDAFMVAALICAVGVLTSAVRGEAERV